MMQLLYENKLPLIQKCYTCHNISAVITCAKVQPTLIIRNVTKMMIIFMRLQLFKNESNDVKDVIALITE